MNTDPNVPQEQLNETAAGEQNQTATASEPTATGEDTGAGGEGGE